MKGVDVNTGSYIFGKPLLNAAWKGHFETVQFLLSEGADTEAYSPEPIKIYKTTTMRMQLRS